MKNLINKNIIYVFSFALVLNVLIYSEARSLPVKSVSFYNIGQGDAAMIQDGMTQVLIDAGPSAKIIEKIGRTIPILDKKIDLLVVTHFDRDHFRGFFDVINKYDVGAVLYHSPDKFDPDDTQLLELIKNNNIQVLSPVAGQIVQVGGIKLEVLHPFVGEKTISNDRGIVLKYCEVKCILFTADSGFKSHRIMEMAYANNEIEADILKVSHHGSKNNTDKKFLSYINPQVSIVSVGKNNYGHPDDGVLELLKDTKILRTDKNGDIVFFPDLNKIKTSIN